LIDAQSAERSAQELGAGDEPKAQLSLKRARDQIAAAEEAIAEGENRTADALLIRARADAELALAQARETDAQLSLKEAEHESAQQKKVNKGQGAVQ
jgi:sRNA-binding protein